jgi:hypothetical protein
MIDHLRAVATSDPFNVRGALEFEFTMPRNWVSRRYGGPGQMKELLAFLGADGSLKPADPHFKALDAMSPADLQNDMERYEAFGRQVLGAFDANADLAPFSAAAASGDHGHWAALFSPSLDKPMNALKKYRADAKAAIERLAAYKPFK